jgi:Domain of unknown function (DUF4190)
VSTPGPQQPSDQPPDRAEESATVSFDKGPSSYEQPTAPTYGSQGALPYEPLPGQAYDPRTGLPLSPPPVSPYGQQNAYPSPYGPPPGYGPQNYSPQNYGPQNYGGYPPPGYGGYAPTAPTNGMAIASLILGILWLYWVGSIMALVFGYIAQQQIRQRGESGNGLATAGIVLGWIGVATLALMLFFFVFFAAAAPSPYY